ncbi:MAG: pyrroline-5-carboxylate reductase [Rubrivivax sp.]
MPREDPRRPAITVFIGGGNMAGALIGGLLRTGHDPVAIRVVEPLAAQRERLAAAHGIAPQAAADARLADADVIVWAVKPQAFAEAAAPCAAFVGGALQLSVMAGVRSDAITRATGSRRIVRAMPNTPALIGQGIAGLFASEEVSADERRTVERLLAPTGATLWVDTEADLDAVTALSGSGPAYVFYLLEAMTAAAGAMGLDAARGRALAIATVGGAAALAAQSTASPATLRQQVTSPNGTTHAAISVLEAAGVRDRFVEAMLAAQRRARELGDAFDVGG